jgi:hypothetical protein
MCAAQSASFKTRPSDTIWKSSDACTVSQLHIPSQTTQTDDLLAPAYIKQKNLRVDGTERVGVVGGRSSFAILSVVWSVVSGCGSVTGGVTDSASTAALFAVSERMLLVSANKTVFLFSISDLNIPLEIL